MSSFSSAVGKGTRLEVGVTGTGGGTGEEEERGT